MNPQDEILNGLISDLVQSNIPLSQSLLKAKIIAYSLNNEKFKHWIEGELNGYVGQSNVPAYRIIPSTPVGNLIQDRGFGGLAQANNYVLPLEQIKRKDVLEYLMKIKLHDNIAELEAMANSDKEFSQSIPPIIYSLFEFSNGWAVHSAFHRLNSTALKGVINKIKSQLLEFLLELKQEFGNINNLNFMENKDKVNQIYDKTIGKIEGKNINITIGDNNDSLSVVNQGDNSNLNLIKGNNNRQESDYRNKIDELRGFIESFKDSVGNSDLSEEDKSDIKAEIQRIDNQINRENPKYNIIGAALTTIKDIAINIPANIAANLISPVFMEQLTMFIDFFVN